MRLSCYFFFIVFLLTGCADSRINDALLASHLLHNPFVTIDEDGSGVSIQGRGEKYDSGVSFYSLKDFLHELNCPNSVLTRIGNTSALMGVQDATWDGLKASWSYHPRSGYSFTLRVL